MPLNVNLKVRLLIKYESRSVGISEDALEGELDL